MKKVLFPILALVLALGLALPVAAHTESDPQVQTLYAGQDIDVGTVSVWNDSDNLYVKYETTGGWEMTETHLAVANTTAGIPQTTGGKKGKGTAGNPIPGQFDYQMEHDPAVTTYTYTIELGDWVPCTTNLSIAAHAAVRKLSDPIPASLASGAGTDSVLVIPEGTSNYPTGYDGPYGGTPVPSVVIQGDANADPGVWPTITGAQWISDSLANPGSANSWRLFTRSFNIPLNAINFSGTLQITSDNAEEAMLNGMPLAGLVDGEVYGVFGDDGEWNTVLPYPIGSYLQPEANMLQVMVRNYYSVVDWNWTGLVYKMDYEYQLILATETAWAADDGPGTIGFPGKNWATYFQYHVQGPSVEEGDHLVSPGEGGVRYKSFANTGSREMYVGIPDLGVSTNRVEVDFTWSSPGTHTVSFEYDATNDKLIGTVGSTTLEWPNISSTATPANWDAMLISVVNRHSGTTVDFNNVELNGYWSLGDFSAGVSEWNNWTVTWSEFKTSWTLTGDIVLTGTFSGGDEWSKVQILVGQHT